MLLSLKFGDKLDFGPSKLIIKLGFGTINFFLNGEQFDYSIYFD